MKASIGITAFGGWLLLAGTVAEAADAATPRLRGLIAARNEAMLSTQINAIIAEMPLRPGDRFRRGDMLVRFDCSVQRAQHQKAEAETRSARKAHGIKQELLKLGSVNPMEVDHAEAEMAKAQADLSQANAILAMCQVKAPFDGRVVEVRARSHESYSSGQPLLFVVEDSQLEIEVIIPSPWLTWIKEGSPFSIRVDETAKAYPGIVSKIGARIDQVSQTIKIYGGLKDRPRELIPGMTGEVVFEGKP